MKKAHLVDIAPQRKGVYKRFSFSVSAVGYENYWKICKVNNERTASAYSRQRQSMCVSFRSLI